MRERFIHRKRPGSEGESECASVSDDPMQEPHLHQIGGWRVCVCVCVRERERERECVRERESE